MWQARVDTLCAIGEVGIMFRALHAALGRCRKWDRVPKRRMRLYAIVAIAAVAVAPFALNQAYRAVLRLDPEWRFVEEVLLRPTSSGTDPLVIRWATSPRIALVEASAEDEAFVRAFVATLDEVLEGSGLSPRLVEGGKSNFQVYFATRARFDRLAVNLGADPLTSGTGFYLIWPSERLDIVAAVAVVGRRSTSSTNRRGSLCPEPGVSRGFAIGSGVAIRRGGASPADVKRHGSAGDSMGHLAEDRARRGERRGRGVRPGLRRHAR